MKKILVITMVLAVVAAMVVPLTVGATADGSPKSGNTEIDASISPNIELNQPSNFTLGTSGVMVVGTNSGNDSHGWVSCNDRGGYDVTVRSEYRHWYRPYDQ
jgi:hypothetical protein